MKRETYDHDGNLPERVHVCKELLRLMFALLHLDGNILIRDVELLAENEDREVEAVNLDNHSARDVTEKVKEN